MSKQFVILSEHQRDGEPLPPIGPRDEIVRRLSTLNTMPEREGEEVLYGPGISIEMPPGVDPVNQMLMTIVEEEIAWQVIARLVKELGYLNRKLSFLLDKETGDLSIQVVDKNSGEVIREIPPEELVAFSRRFREMLGLFVDEQA